MIEMIQSEVELKLRNANDTRTFQEQVCLQKNLKQYFSLEVKNIYKWSFDIFHSTESGIHSIYINILEK